MFDQAVSVITIFLLVPLIIGFFAMRSYKEIARREREEAYQNQAKQEKSTKISEGKAAKRQ